MSTTNVAICCGQDEEATRSVRDRVLRKLSLHEDEGQSLVEFALMLPVLLLVVTGLMTFGVAINNDLLLTDSTNIGARQVAISRGVTDPCSVVSSAVIAAAPLLKPASMTFKTNIGGTVYTGTTCTSAASALTSGATVTVTVTYPCNLRIYNNNNFPTCNLTAQTAELVQ